MSDFASVFQNLDWSVVTTALLMVIPILICLTIHELSHGLVAYVLGDDTAKRAGRLTLNPIRHVDPLGFIMLLVARFGWAKPVPVNLSNLKNPRPGMALISLAGPLSNFLLTALILLFQVPLIRLYSSGGIGHYAADAILLCSQISVILGIFNLLPIPPLDGSKILFSLLPDKQYILILRYERYGMILMLILILAGVFSGALQQWGDTVWSWLFDATAGVSQFLFGAAL